MSVENILAIIIVITGLAFMGYREWIINFRENKNQCVRCGNKLNEKQYQITCNSICISNFGINVGKDYWFVINNLCIEIT